MGGAVNMVQDGKVVAVPEDQVAAAVSQGFHPEDADEQASRVRAGVDDEHANVIADNAVAGGLGFLRSVTLGGSDLAFSGEGAKDLRDKHRVAGIGGEILGALAPVGPASWLNDAGQAVAKIGSEAGVLGRIGYGAAGDALVGAGQAGGSYVSQVALDDKPLSAEGFVGAMGQGALFGGATGAAIGVGEQTLQRAKALFPRSEVTKEAAKEVEQQAQSAMTTIADDSRAMQQTAKQELERLRIEQAKARLATEEQAGELRLRTEASKLERQEALTARAKAGSAKRPRKTFDEPTLPEGATPAHEMPAPGEVPTAGGDDLMSQLQGTKQALDGGADFAGIGAPKGGDFSSAARAKAGELVHTPETAKLADAVSANEAAVSEYDAWLAKYGKGSAVDKAERKFATEDWVEARRSKGPGYVEKVPEGAGNSIIRRGRQMEWRGSEADRLAAEAGINAKVSPEEQLAGKAAAEDIGDKWWGSKVAPAAKPASVGATIVNGAESEAPNIGEQVLASAAPHAAPAPRPSVEESIQGALKPHVGEHVDIGPDISEAARVIGNVEKTSADLAEALGSAAPAAAAERAAKFREAVAAHADQAASASANAADDLSNKLVPEVARRTGKAPTGEMLSRLGDLGAGLEVLKAIGVGVPDLEKIPVVGPVLSLYLKARAAMGVFRRAGGAIPKTAESVIASKAASVRNRVNESVVKMLDTGAAGARAAQGRLGGPMGALGYKLFPSDKREDAKEPASQYRARVDELSRAMQPNAVRNAVRNAVPTSDPALQQEITATMERKLSFLNGKAPREPVMPTLLKGDGTWSPSKVQLEQFARYIKAADDPASVLEDVAHGHAPSMEAAETLRTVYPSLFRQAQMMLIQKASEMQNTLPYSRRVTLSVLFQVPVDGTLSPESIQFLQHATAAAPAPGQGSPAMGGMPAPTMSGPVALGDRTMTALDRRAGA